MAIKPEFIGLLRDIRDRIFPSVSASESVCTEAQKIVVDLTEDLNEIGVVSPVTVVPTQPNGDVGLPDVTYDPETNQFTFSIPAGSDGQDLAITLTFNTLAEMYAYTDPILGTIPDPGTVAFNNEDSKVYVKLDTGENTQASDWSAGTIVTPTTTFQDMSDTPASYTGSEDFFVKVNAIGGGLVYFDMVPTLNSKADLTYVDGLRPEEGENVNGNYIKFNNGTLICRHNGIVADGEYQDLQNFFGSTSGTIRRTNKVVTFPHEFIDDDISVVTAIIGYKVSGAQVSGGTKTGTTIRVTHDIGESTGTFDYIAIGKWK